jgi:hypothetical protein
LSYCSFVDLCEPQIRYQTLVSDNNEVLHVFEGKDFERAVCEKMGIPQEKFRDYHEIVGGDFKDLWLVILELENGQINNGQLVNVSEWVYFWEDSVRKLETAYGKDQWWHPFLAAVDQMVDDNDGEDLMIHFWW